LRRCSENFLIHHGGDPPVCPTFEAFIAALAGAGLADIHLTNPTTEDPSHGHAQRSQPHRPPRQRPRSGRTKGQRRIGIDILRVQEIRSYEEPTRIANAPSFIKGVVNLRGVIVPVVDLRIKLGCDKVEYNGFTVVIVLNVRGRVVGAVVDSVSDVLELAGELIKPAPEMNTNVDTSFITGIASVGERMLILMDIEALMSSTDMGLMDTTQSLQ